MSIGYIYAVIIVIALLWLFILGQVAKDKTNFKAFWHAHGFFLNPFKWPLMILRYKTDADLKQFILRRFAIICLIAHLFPFIVWLTVSYGWRQNYLIENHDAAKFVSELSFNALLLIGLAIGTPVSNIYAAKRFKIVPTMELIKWGELYKKGKHLSKLKTRIVEKLWYGALFRLAFSKKANSDSNPYQFKLFRKPSGEVDVDLSRLPIVTGGPRALVVINTEGFLYSYDNFLEMLPEFQAFTRLRTISIAESGHNSIIKLDCSHNDLPSGIIPYNQVPRSSDLRQINFGFTGKDWIGIKLGKDKNLLVAGNPGAGKSTIYENIIAGAPANTLFVIVDFLKDAIDFSMCKRDPFEIEVLKKKRAAGEIDADEYRNKRNSAEPIPMLTVADTEARAITVFKWLSNELEDRLSLLSDADENNIERLADGKLFNGTARMPHIVVMLDEAAATAFAGKSSSGGEITKIKGTIDRIAVTGRAVGIMMVQATQIPTVESVSSSSKMSARGVYQWIVLNMSAQHIKLLTGNKLSVPGGNEPEFTGTFAKEHGNGYIFGKAAMIEPEQTAKIAWVRNNLNEDSKKIKRLVMSRLEGLVKESVINSQFAQSLVDEGGPSEAGLLQWADLHGLVKAGTMDKTLQDADN